jgi:mitochondrial import inner membrane translocase subunit TIM8
VPATRVATFQRAGPSRCSARMSREDPKVSQELATFIAREQQVAQLQQMIAMLTDVCWDKCISSPGSYLSGRETSCLENCSKRFIDATQYILQRAQHKADGAERSF